MISLSNWATQAHQKLDKEKNAVTGQKEKVMAGPVLTAIKDFCKQDEEFAQAVVQGGSFADCMKAVAKGVGNAISDLDAYKKAVQFYFPGAKVQMQLDTARQNRKNAEEALKAARENPQIPEAMMEEMRQQVAAQVARETTEELEKKLADAESAAQNATRQREIAEVQIEELEKQLRAASPNMVRLGNYLEAMQEAWDKFIDVLAEIREEDPETADKLKTNTKVKVLDPMVEQLNEV